MLVVEIDWHAATNVFSDLLNPLMNLMNFLDAMRAEQNAAATALNKNWSFGYKPCGVMRCVAECSGVMIDEIKVIKMVK